MQDPELAALIASAQKRNDLLYAWLRHTLLMANGTLTVLISLDAGRGSSGIAQAFLRLTWIMLGLGILTGSAVLYGEVVQARALVKKDAARYLRQKRSGSAQPLHTRAPTVAPFARWMRWSLVMFHESLALAVLSLVAFALSRSS